MFGFRNLQARRVRRSLSEIIGRILVDDTTSEEMFSATACGPIRRPTSY
jgi:hypothetical protein